ncbi:granulocyte-macrophage colony-stimulating factor receptor subunit alpha-like [Alligator sinensis]|uniref:Granulocyte-macrophage colony-stimulating factor receptor subunit alpha-like n=1 Tax=Alligator sinensis TaxID=38654 RepID=A0A1U8D745_ALLSI|nr:granulocyte-macrophage colony-stimulating factor receptor subunit alpha-like [Alligator sinensis]XP_025064293.1 granulocyte-macrophage colony-stimulating factor receptor subunit alpha-like [Alligator sinensis]
MMAVPGLIVMIWCIMSFSSVQAVLQCTDLNDTPSHITNMRVNLRKLEMTWESSLNVTLFSCTLKKDEDFLILDVNNTSCRFENSVVLPLHKGLLFIVAAVYNNNTYSRQCRFIPQGMNGTSVENFSCMIYNLSFMNCTWNAGRNAPKDTQYFLYQQFSKSKDEIECQHYIKDAHGRHTGCIFQQVDKHSEVYFLVNGSSTESEIQFYDEYVEPYKTEILPPPLNITVKCVEDPPRCIVQWKEPFKHNSCLEYEINIQSKGNEVDPNKGSKDPPIIVDQETYTFENFNVKKKYLLQIRAHSNACLLSEKWGEWSKPVEFGSEEYMSSLTITLIFIALGTILVVLFVCFLCKRYCNLKKIFSPVPQPRNKFNILLLDEQPMQKDYVDTEIKYESEEIEIIAVEEMALPPKEK